MRDCTAFSLQGILIYCFGSFPVWETVLPVLFKEFLFAILDLSLYERLYCVISSRNSYLLFWIFAGMRDCTACSLQGIIICYFGCFPVWEMKLPLLFKDFLFAILDLSQFERWNCLFSSRISFLLFWIFPCMRDETASSLQVFLICLFWIFPYMRDENAYSLEGFCYLLFWIFPCMRDCTASSHQGILICYLDLSPYERLCCLFSSRNSYLLFWIFPCMRECTASSHQGILICYFGSFPVWETVLPVLFKEFLFAILDLSLCERWNCLFFSRISYLVFWNFPCTRDCTACSLQGILICYFGYFRVWETILPVLFKEFLFVILDLSLYERLYCVFSSRNSYLLFWNFAGMRDCTACSLQGILICYFGSFPVWETVLPVLFKEFLIAIVDLSLYERLYCVFSSRNSYLLFLYFSLYERLYCLFSSRNSYLLFWIFPCMRDCTACSLQGILICYFGSFPVWETVLRNLFKEFLFAILDLCRYERLYSLFSSRNYYLLFWMFPCMRDETASSLQGFLICYFGSFPVWEMKLPLLFKDFFFAILDLSLYERWNCFFSSSISYLPILDLSLYERWKCLFSWRILLFAILDLSLYERLYC